MSPTTPATSITPTLRRRRGLTEEAAVTAIDQACRRLRLPTIRALVDEALTVATKEQLTYQGFLAELLLAEVDDRDRRSSIRRVKAAAFPRDKWLGDFDFDANQAINPATVHELAKGDWIRKGDPLCLIGDSGPASPTCSSPWAPRLPNTATESVTPSPRNWSTSSSRPLTTSNSPRRSPGTAASTY